MLAAEETARGQRRGSKGRPAVLGSLCVPLPLRHAELPKLKAVVRREQKVAALQLPELGHRPDQPLDLHLVATTPWGKARVSPPRSLGMGRWSSTLEGLRDGAEVRVVTQGWTAHGRCGPTDDRLHLTLEPTVQQPVVVRWGRRSDRRGSWGLRLIDDQGLAAWTYGGRFEGTRTRTLNPWLLPGTYTLEASVDDDLRVRTSVRVAAGQPLEVDLQARDE